MARIPGIAKKEDLDSTHHHIFDAIAESRGEVRGPFTMLLHCPELASRVSHLGAYVRFESDLDDKLKELVILTVARELDCQFEWSMHALLARKVGVPDVCVEAIAERRPPEKISDDEANICAYVRELLETHRVSGPTFAAVEKNLGATGCVELSGLVGYYVMLACVLNALEVDPAPTGEVLKV
jgi:4-carboxymuconolactone decarboxylase